MRLAHLVHEGWLLLVAGAINMSGCDDSGFQERVGSRTISTQQLPTTPFGTE